MPLLRPATSPTHHTTAPLNAHCPPLTPCGWALCALAPHRLRHRRVHLPMGDVCRVAPGARAMLLVVVGWWSGCCAVCLLLPSVWGWTELFPAGASPAPRQGHSSVVWGERMLVAFAGRALSSAVLDSAASLLSVNSTCAGMGGCNELSSAGQCNGACASSPSLCLCDCNDGYSGLNCEVQAVDSWLSDVAAFDILDVRWSLAAADPAGTIDPVAWYGSAPHTALPHQRVMRPPLTTLL